MRRATSTARAREICSEYLSTRWRRRVRRRVACVGAEWRRRRRGRVSRTPGTRATLTKKRTRASSAAAHARALGALMCASALVTVAHGVLRTHVSTESRGVARRGRTRREHATWVRFTSARGSGRRAMEAPAAGGDALYGVSTEPSDEDVQVFNSLLQGGSWEAIVGNVKAAANDGRLTTGVLGAAYLVYSESKKRGENEQTLMILQNIIQVLTQAVLTLNASPAQRVMDALMEFAVDEERKLVDKLEEAYNDGINTYDVAEVLRDFIKNLQVQEMSFELEVAKAKEAGWDDQLAKLETLAEERIEAQRRAMNILRLIGVEAPSVPAASPAPTVEGDSGGGFFADQTE